MISEPTKKPAAAYVGKEDDLQIAATTMIKLKYPRWLYIHVANERELGSIKRRDGRTFSPLGQKLKAKGVKSGVPDVLIFDIQFAAEMKVWPNKLTDSQRDVLEQLDALGWYTCVCYSLDDLINHTEIQYNYWVCR